MNYLTLDELKKQLIVDADFHDDDDYITSLGDAAEQLVEQYIDKLLADVVSDYNGALPAPLRQAMKMIVEYLYDNRGSGENEIPEAVFLMIKLYRNYH